MAAAKTTLPELKKQPLQKAAPSQSGTSETQASSSGTSLGSSASASSSAGNDVKCVLDVKELKQYGGIFYGSLPLEDIELFLSQPGDFILRNLETKTAGKQLVITVKVKNGYKNLQIKSKDGQQFCVSKSSKYPSISELVINLVSLKIPIDASGNLLKKPIYRPSWIFLHSQAKFGRKLGEGAFGEVYIARLKANDGSQEFAFPVAIKTMHNKINLESKLEFLKEARVMQKLEHPNIVRVYGVAACGSPVLLAMEICSGGSLLSHLKKHKDKIKIPRKCRYAYEAAQGLAYLEKCGVIHRDIAARNCMLTSNLSIKVGDFGMAETLSEMVVPELKKVPIKWLAIETMQKKIYSHKTDVWAFGILLFEIFGNGEAPYQGFTNMQVRAKIVIQNYRLPPPKDTPEPVGDLMKRCWLTEPKDRPNFSQIAQDLSKHAEPSPRNQPRKSLSDPRKIRKKTSGAAADGKRNVTSEKVIKKAKARKVATSSIPLTPTTTTASLTPIPLKSSSNTNAADALDKSLGRSTKNPKHEKNHEKSAPASGSDLDKSLGKHAKKPKVAAASTEKQASGSDLDKSLGKSLKKKKNKKKKKENGSSDGSSEEKAPPSSGGGASGGSAENSKDKKKNNNKKNKKKLPK
uniref:Tyrosine-protein kinase n=1 Tax=Panagrolaimus sp. PS1159 TaxID=55785 RepID=A0AC35FTZ3_9BILA